MPSSFIKNVNTPSCVNCVHFIKKETTFETGFDVRFGRCKLFGDKDAVTGEIKYNFASLCRYDDSFCKTNGIYFTPKSSGVKTFNRVTSPIIPHNLGSH